MATKKTAVKTAKNGLKSILPLVDLPETASIRFSSDLIVKIWMDTNDGTMGGNIINELTDQSINWNATFE